MGGLFRHGDWICLCTAHNFGRNTNCIACGTMKDIPQKQCHPLLTPSGRAFAVGGRVQNVSSDPLNPCIMYWPDNEPFPEQTQIRPSNVVGVAPPILNTGNRGPISHQPGDWICGKCNYLNWRRRKVCQTCLPYAEGNGDSISAAVQAERIALLTQVLSQASPSSSAMGLTPPLGMRTNTLTPPQVRSRGPSSASHHQNMSPGFPNTSQFHSQVSSPSSSTLGHHGNIALGGRSPSVYTNNPPFIPSATNSPFTTSTTSGGQHGGFQGNMSDATGHLGQGHLGHDQQRLGGADVRHGGVLGRSRSHLSLRGASPQAPTHHAHGGGRASPMIYQTGHTNASMGLGLGHVSASMTGQEGHRLGRAATLNLGHGHAGGRASGLQSSMHAPHSAPLPPSSAQQPPRYQQSQFQSQHPIQQQHHQHGLNLQERGGQGLQSSMHAPPLSAQYGGLQHQQRQPPRRQTVSSGLLASSVHSSFPASSIHSSSFVDQQTQPQFNSPLNSQFSVPHSQSQLHGLHHQAFEQHHGQHHEGEQHQQLYSTGPLPGAFSHPPSVASSVTGGRSENGSPELSRSGETKQGESGRREEGGEAFPVIDDREIMNLSARLSELPLSHPRSSHIPSAQQFHAQQAPSNQPQQRQAPNENRAQGQQETLYSTATPREHHQEATSYRPMKAEGPQSRLHAPAPAALLPAFLQELIIQSRSQGQARQEHRGYDQEQDGRYASGESVMGSGTGTGSGLRYNEGSGRGMGHQQTPPSLSPASAGSVSEASSELHEQAATVQSRPRVSSGSTDSEDVGRGVGSSIWGMGFGGNDKVVGLANGTNRNGSGSGSERSSPGYNRTVGGGMFGATPFAATPTAFGHGHGVGVIGMGRVR